MGERRGGGILSLSLRDPGARIRARDLAMKKWGGDLKSARAIYWKGFLFLVTGLLSACGILVQSPTLLTLFLLLIVIWSFCRLYYFLFYVIEHYVDPSFRFASITSFLIYLYGKRKKERGTPD